MLTGVLEEKEEYYRSKIRETPPEFEGIECYYSNNSFQRQFFVLDKNGTIDTLDTIVVLVGVNYTQGETAEKSIYPEPTDKCIKRNRKKFKSN